MSEHLIDGEKPSKKKERFEFMQQIWLRPTPHDLDIVDAGDHVNIVACTADVVGWWISKLRTMYPQDIMGEKGHCFTLNPETGVTLKIGKEDGSVKVKGKRHQEWLRENFDTLFGLAEEVQQVGQTEMARQCDYFLNLSDSHMAQDLLEQLPESGAFKDGPMYIYKLWRGLLDQWLRTGGDIYIVSPMFDSRRLADIIMLLVKHKLSKSRVHIFSMDKCEPDQRFPKVFKEAKEMVRDLKGPNKKRLVTEERLQHAEQKIEARFGRLYCKLIALCLPNAAEILVTSASFHKWHFDVECGDTVAFFEMTPRDLINNYLSPLGLSHQVIESSSGIPSPVDEQIPNNLSSPAAQPQ